VTKPKIYRMCLDFDSASNLLNFWEDLVAVSMTPTSIEESKDFRTCHPMHKDGLHDRGKSIREFLIREDNPGNGKRLEVQVVPGAEKEVVL
jgi:hypothetical protein